MSEMAQLAERINVAMDKALWKVADSFNADDWNSLTHPSWPFVYEGFRHSYKCSICGEVL